MEPRVDAPQDIRETHRRALADRVLDLTARGIIDASLIAKAREGDQIVTVDFRGNDFEIALHRRSWVAEVIPADGGDEMLDEMREGQPALHPAEATAAWCVAVEWRGETAGLEIHCRLRAWRAPPQGHA